MLDFAAVGKNRVRDHDDIVIRRIGHIDDRDLVVAETLGVVARRALDDRHLEILLQDAGDEFADEQDDDAGMDQLDAGFSPHEFQAVEVRRD